MIGYARTTKRIVSRQAYTRGQLIGAQHDGNREWITLLAAIVAIGRKISPALIYKGESYDLQSTWIEDVKPEDQVFFASSSNRWSSNDHGMAYLKTVLEPQTRDSSTCRRLLIVDGHSSHVNLEFINFCNQHRILVLILPLHSTYRLQPLDVGLFQPLSTAYSAELDNLTAKSGGIVSMKKRMFWSIFKPAWEASFTPKNIVNAFAKCGIWPINPYTVCGLLPPRDVLAAQDIDSMTPRTPISCQAVRRLEKSYKTSPTAAKLGQVFRSLHRLAAQHSINTHTTCGLR
jgi:hypothetical protein